MSITRDKSTNFFDKETNKLLESANALQVNLIAQLNNLYKSELRDDFKSGFFDASNDEIDFAKCILARPIFTTPLTTVYDIYQFLSTLDTLAQESTQKKYKRMQRVIDPSFAIDREKISKKLTEVVNSSFNIEDYLLQILAHLSALENENANIADDTISSTTLENLRIMNNYHQEQITHCSHLLHNLMGSDTTYQVFYEYLLKQVTPNVDDKNKELCYQTIIQEHFHQKMKFDLMQASNLPDLINADANSLLKYLFTKELTDKYARALFQLEKTILWNNIVKTQNEISADISGIKKKKEWYASSFSSDSFGVQTHFGYIQTLLMPLESKFDVNLEDIDNELMHISNIIQSSLQYEATRQFQRAFEPLKQTFLQEIHYGLDKIDGKSVSTQLTHIDEMLDSTLHKLDELIQAKNKTIPQTHTPPLSHLSPTKNIMLTNKASASLTSQPQQQVQKPSLQQPAITKTKKKLRQITSRKKSDANTYILPTGVIVGIAIGLCIGITLAILTGGFSIFVATVIGATIGGGIGYVAGDAVSNYVNDRNNHIAPPPENPPPLTTVTPSVKEPDYTHLHGSGEKVFHHFATQSHHSDKEIIRDALTHWDTTSDANNANHSNISLVPNQTERPTNCQPSDILEFKI